MGDLVALNAKWEQYYSLSHAEVLEIDDGKLDCEIAQLYARFDDGESALNFLNRAASKGYWYAHTNIAFVNYTHRFQKNMQCGFYGLYRVDCGTKKRVNEIK